MTQSIKHVYFGRKEYGSSIQTHAAIFYNYGHTSNVVIVFEPSFETLKDADTWLDEQEAKSGINWTLWMADDSKWKFFAWLVVNHDWHFAIKEELS